jgi:hypothetical protein
MIAVSLMLVFHIGLGFSMELALYTWAPVIAALALLPPVFWDRMVTTIAKLLGIRYYSRGLVVYYDADLPISRTLLSIACTFLGLHPPLLAAQQTASNNNNNEGEGGTPILKILKDSQCYWMVVDSTGKRYAGSNALMALISDTAAFSPVMFIVSKLSILFKFAYQFWVIVFALLPDSMLSTPQYTLPTIRRSSIRLPPIVKKIRVEDAIATFFLLFMLWWNIGATNSDYEMSGGLKTIGTAVRIDQVWNMFAPFPMKDDGWFIIPGRLANGKEVDLFNDGEAVSYDKPKYVSKTFEDSRWRKYMMNLWTVTHQDKRLFFGRYLCRQWNWYGEGREDATYLLQTFRLIYMREITLPNYKVKGPDAIVLWEHQC